MWTKHLAACLKYMLKLGNKLSVSTAGAQSITHTHTLYNPYHSRCTYIQRSLKTYPTCQPRINSMPQRSHVSRNPWCQLTHFIKLDSDLKTYQAFQLPLRSKGPRYMLHRLHNLLVNPTLNLAWLHMQSIGPPNSMVSHAISLARPHTQSHDHRIEKND